MWGYSLGVRRHVEAIRVRNVRQVRLFAEGGQRVLDVVETITVVVADAVVGLLSRTIVRAHVFHQSHTSSSRLAFRVEAANGGAGDGFRRGVCDQIQLVVVESFRRVHRDVQVVVVVHRGEDGELDYLALLLAHWFPLLLIWSITSGNSISNVGCGSPA